MRGRRLPISYAQQFATLTFTKEERENVEDATLLILRGRFIVVGGLLDLVVHGEVEVDLQFDLRVVGEGMTTLDRDDLRDRLGMASLCRLPRALTVAQRRRAGMAKQWSMDETQTWFYSRSPSLDRQSKARDESDQASTVKYSIHYIVKFNLREI